MAALQCELCGGKLQGKPGGVFECDSCGMEYSTEWAKAKIQEIRGTVKVEGTVQVQGSVTVEGSANKDSLMKRGLLALEDRNWDDAKKYFDRALDIDPECAQAYLGKCCSRFRLRNTGEIANQDRTSYLADPDYKKALWFAGEDLKKVLAEYEQTVGRAEERRKENEAKRKMEEAIRKEQEKEAQRRIDEAERQAKKQQMEAARNRILPFQHLIYADNCSVVAVTQDGRIIYLHWTGELEYLPGISKAIAAKVKYLPHNGLTVTRREIISVLHSNGTVLDYLVVSEKGKIKVDKPVFVESYVSEYTFNHSAEDVLYHYIRKFCGEPRNAAVKDDGTVVYEGLDTSRWKDVVAVSVRQDSSPKNSKPHISMMGLRADGSVYHISSPRECRLYPEIHWKNMIALSVGRLCTIGLQEDGTIVTTAREETGKIKLFTSMEGMVNAQINAIMEQIEVCRREQAVAKVKQRIQELKSERSKLGLFGNGQEKKRLDKEIEQLSEKVIRIRTGKEIVEESVSINEV